MRASLAVCLYDAHTYHLRRKLFLMNIHVTSPVVVEEMMQFAAGGEPGLMLLMRRSLGDSCDDLLLNKQQRFGSKLIKKVNPQSVRKVF